MRGSVENCRAVLLALLMVGLTTEIGVAQDAARPGPPVRIGGFSYQYIDRGRVHMNLCQQPTCVPGSKVSYILYAPKQNPDFEEFKLAQEKVASVLKSRAPKDTVITFGKPQRESDSQFTIFSNTREVYAANGVKQFTKSTLFHSKKITISLISSSRDKEAVDANSALFLVGLMTWSQTLKGSQ